jgi:hypothetical protein
MKVGSAERLRRFARRKRRSLDVRDRLDADAKLVLPFSG